MFKSHNLRLAAIVLALTMCLTAATCDHITESTAFRITILETKAVVPALVPTVLTQVQADAVLQDIDDSAAAARRCDVCLKAVTGDDAQKKVGNALCYLKMAGELRPILARHHLTGSRKLELIAAIIQGAIDAFQEFHDNVIPPPPVAGAPLKVSKPVDADKQLERRVKEIKKLADEVKQK